MLVQAWINVHGTNILHTIRIGMSMYGIIMCNGNNVMEYVKPGE